MRFGGEPRAGCVLVSMEREDLIQVRDLEEPQDHLAVADDAQIATASYDAPEGAEQDPETGAVQVGHVIEIDDQTGAAVFDQRSDLLLQLWGSVEVDLAAPC